MNFKKWWVKKSIIKKSMWISGFAAVVISFLLGFAFTIIPSIMRGKLVCPTFGGDVGCGNIIGFILFSLVPTFWVLLFTFVPFIKNLFGS
ncbi:hypothetical protein HYS31_01350 [Candidatus Woesearchaeota archaeon]|nr:hypothetical protein [Candidatus Woesearchaeota archaeon]